MYLTKKMLADKNDVSVPTVNRIIREMEESGNYPTAIRRCGRVTIDEEAFEHYVRRRKRKIG
jgi:predicted site-specific integrase-resolvase